MNIISMHGRRMLALTLLVCGCCVAGVAQGYRDVTAEALVNPSFELADTSTPLSAATATNISEAYGWTLPTGTSNMAVADTTTTAIGFTNSKGGVRPSDGSFFLWYRKGWGNLSTVVSTTTRPLAAGKYYVEVDYKAADYSNNNNHATNGTKMSIVVADADGQSLGQSTDARRAHSFANGSSNPGSDTYLATVPWTRLGCFFTVKETGVAILSVKAALVNNGRSDICLDNVRVYHIDDDTTDGQTAFPLDVTGTLANPSFEAGAGGTSWTAHSYNGWTVARSGSEIKADGGTYAQVFGERLDGLLVFNAWDNSSTTDKTLSQQVNGLPAGRYRLQATVTGATGGQFSIFAGDSVRQVTVADGAAVQTETLDFDKATDAPITVGLQSTVFYKVDNFRLAYIGKDVSQARAEYAQALTLAQAVMARAADLGDLTATEKMTLQAAIEQQPEATLEGYQAAADSLRQAAQALARAEHEQVKRHYAAEMELGSWTNSNVTTNQGQHWDGSSTSPYYEQKDGWGNSAWTMSMSQAVTLPAGRYALRAAGRHSAGDMTMALAVSASGKTLASASDFPSGDTGLGINLDGQASVLPADGAGFANQGNGYGWQWRYLPFELQTETTVTVAVTGEAREAKQWMSICDIALLREGASQGNFDTNPTKTVGQVTTSVVLTEPVDYVVTSSSAPFATSGSVDIAHEDATIILSGVKPSEADAWLPFVKVYGKDAVEGTNCSIRIYGNGAMIVPYGSFVQPLTVYDGLNLTGEQKSDFTVGDRRSLKNNVFNNKIRSFKLKRGYMVTLATGADGKGYSRVFIADKANRRVNLPTTSKILDHHVSSLRLSKWNDVTKKGYAGSNATINSLLNTTWCYNWDAGWHEWDDREYVTQHHHEGWPSIENVGNNGPTANILGNNEPDNTADQRETVSSVSEVLAHWQEMMATGKRLGSPAMASNLTGWLYPFIDSIDARGWRCDFIAVHAYYYQDWAAWQTTLKEIHERTGRPIWITEMNYGANWTGWPGSNTNGNADNYAIEKQHFAPVIDGLEQTGWVERYAVYNEVQNCRKVYNSGDASLKSKNYLTPMGEYYAAKKSNIAYNASYGYTPKALPMKDPTITGATLQDGTLQLSWSDPNEEFSDSVIVERLDERGLWQTASLCTPQEDNPLFSLCLLETGNATYRIRTVDYLGRSHYSAMASVGPVDGVGSAVTVDGRTLYLGGNILANADFDEGLRGWTGGDGKELTWPAFEAYPVGGADGGAYLQAFKNEGAASGASLKRTVNLTASTPYYIGVFHNNNGGGYQTAALSTDGTTATATVLSLPAATVWSKAHATFESGDNTQLLFSYRWLGKSAQFDKFMVAQLFDTPAEAYADGVARIRQDMSDFMAWNQSQPVVNTLLAEASATVTATDAEAYATLASLLRQARRAVSDATSIDSLVSVAKTIAGFSLPGASALLAAVADAETPTSLQSIAELRTRLQQAVDEALPAQDKTAIITNADLSAATGWNTAAGTYKGGDQRLNTFGGRKCWNAWWNVSTATAAGRTLALTQELAGLPMGYYRLTADATTQHYCLSDQHSWMRTEADSSASPTLTYDRMQIPGIGDDDRWQTLSTQPLYVGEDGLATIGFQSSKQGVTEGAYDDDNRAGWWLASRFRLWYTPAYQRVVDAKGEWTTVCLPFAATPSDSVSVYTVTGRSADGSALYLTEVSNMEAGKPYVCRYHGSRITFLGGAATVSRPVTGGAMTGVFQSVNVPQGAYILDGGEWRKVENVADVALPHYSAYITSFDQLPVVEGGAASMPLQGIADGISDVISNDGGHVPYYNLAGQRTTSKHGVLVQKNKKIVRK